MIRRLAGILSLAITVIGALWCLFLRDPHLLSIRQFETAILLALLSTALILARVTPYRFIRKSVPLAAVALAFFISAADLRLQQLKTRLLRKPTANVLQINRRLIMGYNDDAELAKLAANGIGGIFLTQRNIRGKTLSQVQQHIAGLQRQRAILGLPPLIVTTDQEGGPVSRLSPLVKRQPPLADLVSSANRYQTAFLYGLEQGRQLSTIGVTVNFSPVVDLKPSNGAVSLDFHTLLHTRAISSTPDDIVSVALPYIKGLKQAGVDATLKHFPGLRETNADTHHLSARLDTSVEELEQSDWMPFKRLASATGAWIMLSHTILTAVDEQNPVSTSSKVVDTILRTRLKFKGILVTDDLTMGATYNRGFCKSVRGAYAADIDYLLIAYDYEKYYDLIACLSP